MKQRPILFNTEMVRAILQGRKTQTRRIVKLPPWSTQSWDDSGPYEDDPSRIEVVSRVSGCTVEQVCPYGKPGDLLWVRETWADLNERYPSMSSQIIYRADKEDRAAPIKWKPSIFMPRAASRILLEVQDIRVERLQDINEWDAIEEGLEMVDGPDGLRYYGNYGDDNADTCLHPIESYRTLWQSINGPESWHENPWVWVVIFKQISHAHP